MNVCMYTHIYTYIYVYVYIPHLYVSQSSFIPWLVIFGVYLRHPPLDSRARKLEHDRPPTANQRKKHSASLLQLLGVCSRTLRGGLPEMRGPIWGAIVLVATWVPFGFELFVAGP